MATAKSESLGFSREQIQEETLKAQLMLAKPDWVTRLQQAEAHGYFRGQIGFLLDFSGARAKAHERPVQEWTSEEHFQLQESFDKYWAMARLTFNDEGLAVLPGEAHQWQRSLLAVGDYLVRLGRNNSFGTNPPGNPGSWKRWLRDTVGASRRDHLKTLWDRLDLASDVGSQLAEIREAADLEPWRAAIVAHPQVIDYCGNREIRWEGPEKVYLLRKRQMNGAHAELFTFVLHIELDTVEQRKRLTPLQLLPYQSVNMTDTEPHVILAMGGAKFTIITSNERFRIATVCTQLATMPGVEEALLAQLGFSQHDAILRRFVPREKIVDFLLRLASVLAEITTV